MNRRLLGKRICEERLRIGLTQEQPAEYIDVSTTYVGFIERGERSVTLEKLALIANCFHITIDSLLHEETGLHSPRSPVSLYESYRLIYEYYRLAAILPLQHRPAVTTFYTLISAFTPSNSLFSSRIGATTSLINLST